MKNVHLDMEKTPQCYLKTLEIQQYKGHVKTFTALKLLLLLFNVYPKRMPSFTITYLKFRPTVFYSFI